MMRPENVNGQETGAATGGENSGVEAAKPEHTPLTAGLGPDLLLFPPARDPQLLNPLVLAYVGDAVYEIFVRQHVVSLANHRPNQLHRLAIRHVSAKAQARTLERWLPLLSEEELDIVRRGRNAKSGTAPKNADVLEYRHSTALECLVGYLYYRKRWDRLAELVKLALVPDELLCD